MKLQKPNIFSIENSTILKCPKCKTILKEIKVKIQDANSKVKSYQCGKCGYFEFEDKSAKKIITELREKETILKIKQKIIKLSHNRLGMYLNKDITRSLDLKGGEEIYISVPDKKQIIISINR